jgi:hypothetical protein
MLLENNQSLRQIIIDSLVLKMIQIPTLGDTKGRDCLGFLFVT